MDTIHGRKGWQRNLVSATTSIWTELSEATGHHARLLAVVSAETRFSPGTLVGISDLSHAI